MLPEGRRILLFSQFTSMLDLIKPRLDAAGIGFVELRGDTRDRAEPVRAFESGEVPLFLISLKAGGRGLNLTSADTVIHYDPWWNPAAEDQASDRAHRIGQTKSVFVYKLIAADTVEDRIVELQQRKADLANIALSDERRSRGSRSTISSSCSATASCSRPDLVWAAGSEFGRCRAKLCTPWPPPGGSAPTVSGQREARAKWMFPKERAEETGPRLSGYRQESATEIASRLCIAGHAPIVGRPKRTTPTPTQTERRITDNPNELLVELTEGAIRNGNCRSERPCICCRRTQLAAPVAKA